MNMNAFMEKLARILRKLMDFSLKNRWVVLLGDLVICCVSFTLTALMHNRYIGNSSSHDAYFLAGTLYFVYYYFTLLLFKAYRSLIRHMQFLEMGKFALILILPCLALYLTIIDSSIEIILPFFFVINLFFLNLIIMMFFRLGINFIYNYFHSFSGKKHNDAMIYGIGTHSVALAHWLTKSGKLSYNLLGFITRNHGVRRTGILENPVFNLEHDDVFQAMLKRNVKTLIFPDYKSVLKERQFVSQCMENGVSVLVAPPFEGLDISGKVHYQMKPIKFEDLLGRDEININTKLISQQIGGKVIMITGAAGSIGSEIVRQMHQFDPKMLVLFDIAESPLHSLRMMLESNYPELKFVIVVGDIRNEKLVDHVFRKYKPTVVYHAAAYKHVPLMEENPCEALLDNVLGTKNLADISVANEVERFIMISTDKAVNPTNVMGATKRTAEIYIQSLAKDCISKGIDINFVTTRFGNVLGSSGSVIPYFKEQIENGGPVTVTDRNIVRYFMTIPEASRLVLEAASFGKSGEIYVFDMGKPVRILDLAEKMIEMAGMEPYKDIEIKFTNLRPGEKLYEELLSDKENTLPTINDRIRVASVHSYEYESVCKAVADMIRLAINVDIEGTVIALKRLIPEYKSQNSPFEKYDKMNDKS